MTDFEIKNINIAGLKLALLDNSYDENWYKRRDTVEEINSKWYAVLAKMGIKTLVDVGANYGMIGAICAKEIKDINVIAIEADPRLVPLIEQNLILNNVSGFKVVNAAVGEDSCKNMTFSLNPKSTLDNRVNMSQWHKVSVPGITLDELLSDEMVEFPLYIKIDTQGFERSVFRGADKLLSHSNKWIIKTEFAPHWLESQGTNPQEFLEELILKFSVFESPQRHLFKAGPDFSELGSHALDTSDAAKFVAHVKSLNIKDLGWVDLIVMPR